MSHPPVLSSPACSAFQHGEDAAAALSPHEFCVQASEAIQSGDCEDVLMELRQRAHELRITWPGLSLCQSVVDHRMFVIDCACRCSRAVVQRSAAIHSMKQRDVFVMDSLAELWRSNSSPMEAFSMRLLGRSLGPVQLEGVGRNGPSALRCAVWKTVLEAMGSRYPSRLPGDGVRESQQSNQHQLSSTLQKR